MMMMLYFPLPDLHVVCTSTTSDEHVDFNVVILRSRARCFLLCASFSAATAAATEVKQSCQTGVSCLLYISEVSVGMLQASKGATCCREMS